MKLTKSQLKEVIEEELISLLADDELKSLDELLNEAEELGSASPGALTTDQLVLQLLNHVKNHEGQLEELRKRVEELTTQVNIPAARAQQYVQRAGEPPEPTGTSTRQVVVRETPED